MEIFKDGFNEGGDFVTVDFDNFLGYHISRVWKKLMTAGASTAITSQHVDMLC